MQSALLASMVASGLVLAGCAAAPATVWRMEPTLRVAHAQGAQVAQGFVALARQYEGERRLPQALEAWRKASAAAPYDADILNSLGMAEAGQGHVERAVEVLRLAVALAPGQARLRNNLGHALHLAGHSEESADMLRQALALDPGYRMARINLARAEAEAAAIAVAEVPPMPAAPSPTPVAAPAPVVPSNAPTVSQAQASPLQTVPNLTALKVSQATATAAAQRVPDEPSPPLAATAAKNPPPMAVARDGDARSLTQLAQDLHAGKSQPALGAEKAAPKPAVAAAPPRADLQVEVSNGNGVEGMAGWVRGFLRAHGLADKVRLTNMPDFQNQLTVVQYREGFEAEAQAIALGLPQPAMVAKAPSKLPRGDVRVLLGHDIRTAIACGSACPDYKAVPAVHVAAATTPG